jgi:hypothetical protein
MTKALCHELAAGAARQLRTCAIPYRRPGERGSARKADARGDAKDGRRFIPTLLRRAINLLRADAREVDVGLDVLVPFLRRANWN